MDNLFNWFSLGAAAIGGVVGWFFGGMDGSLYMLIAFVVVDYLVGVARAIFEKKLSSEIGTKGITKKVVIFLLVGIAHLLDVEILGAGDALRNVVIFFYIANEGISILENAAFLGLPIPKKLKSILKQLHNTEEDEQDGN